MDPSRPPDAHAERARALELIRTRGRFLLSGHQRPDGDCLGSQAAMASLLRALGKQVWILNPDAIEPRYRYLEVGTPFRAWRGGDLPVHEVCIVLDFSELSRTGELAPLLARADSKKIVVDHHIHHGERWWDAAYVDVGAAATGLLVRRIARDLGLELDLAAATGIFTAIVTDTGWFKYSNTDAETLAAAAEMLGLGVEPARLYRELYQQRSHHHPAYVGQLLARAEYFAERRLVVVDQPLSDAVDPDLVDSDEVLDILRSVGSVEVVLFLRELASGSCKLSARSKSDYDVNALARAFGGGGHKKASGATIPGRLAEVRARVVEQALQGFSAAAAAPLER